MDIKHWFLPHKETHKKARLISWEGIVVYILLCILLQVSFQIIGFMKPGVLGTSTNITLSQIIELTNKERVKAGLEPLREDMNLDVAAKQKALNMFSENYWAHFAPSGKTPWDFIIASGYRFSFAGENLAKNFYSPEEVVSAWMVSPTHRENLLNPKYKDIGISIEDGVLNGQKTTLVVQMFGTTTTLVGAPSVKLAEKEIQVSQEDLNKPSVFAAAQTNPYLNIKPVFDPFLVNKYLGLMLIAFVFSLLLLDLVILKKRGVIRLGSYHLSHMVFLTFSAIIIFLSIPGSIL